MTSDTVTTTDTRSEAQEKIDLVCGDAFVKLSELTGEEFDNLLKKVLAGLDLRELRGFKPLKEFLSQRPVCGGDSDAENNVEFPYSAIVANTRVGDPQITAESHVMGVARNIVRQRITFCRYESGEETTDYKVYQSWGYNRGYIKKVERTLLVLHRPNNHTYADKNLFVLRYTFKKVPHEDKMQVTYVDVGSLRIGEFRKHFGNQYAAAGSGLIRDVRDQSRSTLETLRSKAESFEYNLTKLDRLASSVME